MPTTALERKDSRIPAVVVVIIALTVSLHLPAIAEIWGVKTLGPLSGPPSTLFRFDEDGPSVSAVGVVTLDGQPVDVDGLALDAGGTLYAFVPGDASGLLVTLDPITAVATAVGYVSGREIRGAAFTPSNELIGIDIFFSALVGIDPATASQVGPPVPLTLDGKPFAVDFGTDLTIGAGGAAVLCSGPADLYAVDLATGALSVLLSDTDPGPDGATLHGAGLAFAADAADGRLFLYDFGAEDDIFSYAPPAPFTRAIVVADFLSGYDAGRGDLASYPRERHSGVGDGGPPPARPQLAISPNPSNPRTTVSFDLPRAGRAEIAVFTLAGRKAAVLADGVFAAGPHRVAWDGRDARGRAVPSGAYLVGLATASGRQTRKLTLVR